MLVLVNVLPIRLGYGLPLLGGQGIGEPPVLDRLGSHSALVSSVKRTEDVTVAFGVKHAQDEALLAAGALESIKNGRVRSVGTASPVAWLP